ncbi:lipid II flippase MurJ [Patulibacter sp. NPDC049589]|uniref:lipid II flippase MurJ n=1 Tax=Patulibacter sp. NPDC049589 TaxID=3154731 RepID=UPI00341EEB66
MALGIGTETDVYFFALSFCLFATGILENTIHANAVTVFASAQRFGPDRLKSAVWRVVVGSTSAAALGFGVLAMIGTFAIESNDDWSSHTQHIGVVTLWIFSATVVASAASSVYAATLYSVGAFFTAPATVAFRSIGALASLPVTRGTELALPGLAIGLAVGETVRVSLLRRAVIRELKPVTKHGAPPEGSVPSLIKPSMPYALSISFSQATPVVDRAIGSSLGPGTVTTIDLSEKVFFVPMTVMWSSIVVVSGARWSHLAATERRDLLVADFRQTIRRSLWLSSAIAAGMGACLVAATAVIGPTFAGMDATRILWVSLILLAGLPPAAVAALAGRYLSAARRTTSLPLFSATALAMSTSTSIVGAHYVGIFGIVLAATATRWTMAAAFYAKCVSGGVAPTEPRIVTK